MILIMDFFRPEVTSVTCNCSCAATTKRCWLGVIRRIQCQRGWCWVTLVLCRIARLSCLPHIPRSLCVCVCVCVCVCKCACVLQASRPQTSVVTTGMVKCIKDNGVQTDIFPWWNSFVTYAWAAGATLPTSLFNQNNNDVWDDDESLDLFVNDMMMVGWYLAGRVFQK